MDKVNGKRARGAGEVPAAVKKGPNGSHENATHTNSRLLRLVEDVASLYEADIKCSVRHRGNLPSGDSELLPESIGAPSSASFPCAIQPVEVVTTASVEDYAKEAQRLMDDDGLLLKHGAVLFRGLPVSTPEDFATFCESLGWESSTLGGGGTVRTTLTKNVRTASDEPPEHTIEPHLDMAHNPEFPHRIAFFMYQGPPKGSGGETVLVDMRKVTVDMKVRFGPAARARLKLLSARVRVRRTGSWPGQGLPGEGRRYLPEEAVVQRPCGPCLHMAAEVLHRGSQRGGRHLP